jgi:putative ABC transport system permease protein
VLRSYVSAALANLGRNWLYAGVTVLGLAVSFAAAILIGLYVRDEYTFERFIPDNQRVYRFEAEVTLPGQRPQPMVFTSGRAAGFLKLDFPEIETAARLSVTRSEIKIGGFASTSPVAWADPDFFRVMAYPVLAGDARAALEAPDGVVLTHQAARRLFGADAPIGRVLLIDPALDFARGLPPEELRMLTTFHPMRVMAVLADMPSNTHLDAGIYASGRAPFSATALDERRGAALAANDLTYVKLRPGISAAALAGRLAQFGDRRFPEPGGGPSRFRYRLLALADVHFSDAGLGPEAVLRPAACSPAATARTWRSTGRR